MTRFKSALVALWMLTAAPAFAQTNVTGEWDIRFKSDERPNGALVALDAVDVIAVIALKQNGDDVSGTYRSAQGHYDFSGGVLSGNKLRFLFTIRTNGVKFQMRLIGTVEGSTMTGKAYFGNFAEQEWIAVRSATTAVGFVGKWDVVLKMPDGDMPATTTLTSANGRLSGTFASRQGEVPVTGTTDGQTFRIAMVAQTPQGERAMVMVGDLDGDQIINGTADVAGIGQIPWTATRARQ